MKISSYLQPGWRAVVLINAGALVRTRVGPGNSACMCIRLPEYSLVLSMSRGPALGQGIKRRARKNNIYLEMLSNKSNQHPPGLATALASLDGCRVVPKWSGEGNVHHATTKPHGGNSMGSTSKGMSNAPRYYSPAPFSAYSPSVRGRSVAACPSRPAAPSSKLGKHPAHPHTHTQQQQQHGGRQVKAIRFGTAKVNYDPHHCLFLCILRTVCLVYVKKGGYTLMRHKQYACQHESAMHSTVSRPGFPLISPSDTFTYIVLVLGSTSACRR